MYLLLKNHNSNMSQFSFMFFIYFLPFLSFSMCQYFLSSHLLFLHKENIHCFLESYNPAKWETQWPRRNGSSSIYTTGLIAKHLIKSYFSTGAIEYLDWIPVRGFLSNHHSRKTKSWIFVFVFVFSKSIRQAM